MDTIVVVAKDKKDVNLICKAINKLEPEMTVEVISSLEDLPKREDKKYKGFLIDFRTMFGCSTNHKIMTSLVEELFPVAKFRVNKDDSIGMICSSLSSDLNSFLKGQVKSFGARRVRRHERVVEHLPVKYSLDGGSSWQETITLNASISGLFIIGSDTLVPGQEILVQLSQSIEQKKAVVRWVNFKPNLNPKVPPGFGVEFLETP